MKINLMDCTLRDGGYYNAWDFSPEVIEHYLKAMDAISVDYVEICFRTLSGKGYKGGCGYSTDSYIRSLNIPSGLRVAVMVNAGELVKHPEGVISALQKLFAPAADSPVFLVRIACHMHEIELVMPGVCWLKEKGYLTTVNFMQIADRSQEEISGIAKLAGSYPLDVLYFADSMGSLSPDQTAGIIKILRTHWKGEIGIHTHDNMCQGLAKPMRGKYGWGPNPFYYLAGKYGIHPTYVQEMLGDSRYNEEDILAVIDHLRKVGGKKYKPATMEVARHFYSGKPKGTWVPANVMAGKEVLVLGTGPGVVTHQWAIEEFIKSRRPFVIALNTQTSVAPELIDIRAACHPVRLLADRCEHANLPQPLVIPASQLSDSVLNSLGNKQLFDFGLEVQADTFAFNENHCILPFSLVVAYALAIATSGRSTRILLSGFEGYGAEDPRNAEIDNLFTGYKKAEGALELLAITPTRYKIASTSVYAM